MASGSSGVKTDALDQYGVNKNTAAGALATVSPIYSEMATGNDGLTPQQKTNLLTAGDQSIAGSVAGTVGQGNLATARTGNAGGYAASLDDNARNAMAANSGVALNVQNEDAQVARDNQARGLAGLSNIYNTSNQAGLNYLNLANQSKPSFWQQFGSQAAFGALAAAQSGGGGA